jgi:hypothetical protein
MTKAEAEQILAAHRSSYFPLTPQAYEALTAIVSDDIAPKLDMSLKPTTDATGTTLADGTIKEQVGDRGMYKYTTGTTMGDMETVGGDLHEHHRYHVEELSPWLKDISDRVEAIEQRLDALETENWNAAKAIMKVRNATMNDRHTDTDAR